MAEFCQVFVGGMGAALDEQGVANLDLGIDERDPTRVFSFDHADDVQLLAIFDDRAQLTDGKREDRVVERDRRQAALACPVEGAAAGGRWPLGAAAR